jgi:hypothetical protein
MFGKKLLRGAGKGAQGAFGVVIGIVVIALQLFLYGAFIVLAVWFFLTVVHHFQHNKTATTTSSQASIAPYVATQDNFQIKFPGTPTVDSITPSSDSTGGTTTGRVYDLQNQSTDTEYDVVVDNYSDQNLDTLSGSNLQSALQTSANGLAQGAKSSLSDTSFVTFKGRSAIQGKMTPSASDTLPQYFVLFYNGHDVYAITVATTDQSTFQNFANSFSFLN